MDQSRRSIATNEDSISMYLSFDTDVEDTQITSKWQSVMATQTTQYMETEMMDDTLEEKKTVLKTLMQNDANNTTDQASPLRPFDKSILNKHNALSSTPTKNVFQNGQQNVSTDNKENTQPDEQNSTLSSTIDATASTVKTNTILNEDEISVKDENQTNNIYPLGANVVLENITEVSNEEPSMTMPSPLEDKMNEDTGVTDMVNEVSELISRALKLTEGSTKPKKQPKSSQKPPALPMPRPRRSYLPTVNGTTFKQRMSIVVKTTLNSPARRLSTGIPSARRSCLPAPKPNPIGNAGYRKSTLIRSSMSASSSTRTKPAAAAAVTAAKSQPIQKAAPLSVYKCKLCSASFGLKKLLDTHMDTHTHKYKPTKNKTSCCCNYCDKKFMLERALHIHLMENCTKIPPSEKRKLKFTELNHVAKAKLPKVSCCDSSKSRESPPIGKEPSMGMFQSWPGRQSCATTSAFVASNEGAGASTNTKSAQMAPPSSIKAVAKKAAHSGVYRTPNKTVPCYICKQSFKSILDYTNHSLTVHSKNRKQDTANAPSALFQD